MWVNRVAIRGDGCPAATSSPSNQLELARMLHGYAAHPYEPADPGFRVGGTRWST